MVAAVGRRRVESESGHRAVVSGPANKAEGRSRPEGAAGFGEETAWGVVGPGKAEGDFHLNAVRGEGSGRREAR
jgi:hypothetical protein